MQNLLFHDATVVTMDASRSVLEHTSVAVRDGRVCKVGPAKDLGARYAYA